MEKSIVKVPNNQQADYDYIAFSFRGFHSVEDFGIYRTGDNSGYNTSLIPPLNEKIVEDLGGDGQFYFGTQYKPKVFDIKFAFDGINERKLKKIKQWLDNDDIGDLWFAEEPHKVYSAKITGNNFITAIAYTTKRERFYKGTGSIQLTCYNAHAHTPDIVVTASGKELSGHSYTSYVDFSNYKEIKNTLPLRIKSGTNLPEDTAFGDLPFNFKAKLLSPFDEENITIISDIVGESYYIENATFSEEDGVYIIN